MTAAAGFSLNFLDILLLAIVILSTLFGLIKGFIREVLSLVFFIIALVLSFLYYADVARIYDEYMTQNIAYFAAFVTIFTLILVLGAIVTFFVKKLLTPGPLKIVDRIFGGVFGLLRGIAITAIIVFVLIAFQVKENLVNESRLAPYVLEAIETVFNVTPDKFKEKKDKIIDEYNRQKTSGTS